VAAYRAAGWSIFSSLPQPIVAVPAFLFVMLVRPALPLALGFAAGAMAWMVVSELVPDAREHERDDVAGVIAVLCALAMLAVAWWFSPV
jgi:zinc transporter ZupT